MADNLYLNSPPGRLINGSIQQKQGTDLDGRPIPPDEQKYEIGVAIPKTEPGLGAFFTAIRDKALADFARNPVICQNIQNWPNAQFSFKIKDGDAPSKRDGTVNPNSAGCYVFYLNTMFNNFIVADRNNRQIDPSQINRGDYVDLYLSVAGNNQTAPDRAGVYLSLAGIRLLGYGERIVSGPSVESAFGSVAPQMPAGASQTPLAPQGGLGAPQGMPGTQPQPAPPQQGMPGMPGGIMQQPQGGSMTGTGLGNPPAQAAPTAPAGLGLPGVPVNAGAQGNQTASPGNGQHPSYPQILGVPGQGQGGS